MDTLHALVAELTSNALGASQARTPTSTHTNARTSCRVCGRSNLIRYLDFGVQPLANALRTPEDTRTEFRAPLAVQACPSCRLSQLTYTVPKETLYTEYAYSSGVSAGWRRHCAALAEEYASPHANVIDIAANDGTCLNAFAKRDCITIGVEPARSFNGPSGQWITDYWTRALVEREQLTGFADVLIAQNVLGHVDDVHDFAEGIALALKPDGIAIIEVPYVNALLDSLAFDTIYHEHLSYWSVTALNALCRDHDLVLRNVQELPIHGGSIRAIVGKSGSASQAVIRLLVAEHHDLNRSAYMQFSSRVSRRIAEISAELTQHTPYVGFGAPAKATVLLGVLDVRAYPSVVYDDTPAKQGKLIPGTRVPIEPMPTDWRSAPGPMAVFAWNWSRDIVPKLRKQGYTGAIYIPLPRPRWDTV